MCKNCASLIFSYVILGRRWISGWTVGQEEQAEQEAGQAGQTQGEPPQLTSNNICTCAFIPLKEDDLLEQRAKLSFFQSSRQKG